MRIPYFTKYSEVGPSSRYRVYQLAPYLRRNGIELEIHPLFEGPYFSIQRSGGAFRALRKSSYVAARFVDRLARLMKAGDAAMIEHQLFPYLPFALESAVLPLRYVTEFDDAIFLTHPRAFPRQLANAHAVIAGNDFLGDYARRFNPSVHVIPTVLDTSLFKPSDARDVSGWLRVGWSGVEYNFRYLSGIAPALKAMQQKHNFEFIILSGKEPVNFPIPYTFIRWDPVVEVEQLSSFDIGLMPLEFDDWSEGKCGMKLLQYMSTGTAAIATPVGVNRTIVQDGLNGFHASSLDDWAQKLDLLLTDETLRKNLGTNARQTVVTGYSIDAWLPRIVSAYRINFG